MELDTGFIERCVATLEKAHHLLREADPNSIDYEMYRSACIKEFEIIIEQAGKLLRKILKPYFGVTKAVDRLTFKDVFRHATLRDVMDKESSERWLVYRDSRNTTAHEYGENFAEETLELLPQFIPDAKALIVALNNASNAE